MKNFRSEGLVYLDRMQNEMTDLANRDLGTDMFNEARVRTDVFDKSISTLKEIIANHVPEDLQSLAYWQVQNIIRVAHDITHHDVNAKAWMMHNHKPAQARSGKRVKNGQDVIDRIVIEEAVKHWLRFPNDKDHASTTARKIEGSVATRLREAKASEQIKKDTLSYGQIYRKVSTYLSPTE